MDADKVLRANLWPIDTQVTLCSVPWDSAYRDVVAWESAAARDAYFDGLTDTVWKNTTAFNYLWPKANVRVPVPYSSAYKYNYCVVENPAQPVTGEGDNLRYFYFVTDVNYLSPQASELTVQLDVMTTYAGSIQLGRAFVERGHIAMANSNARPGMASLTGGVLNEYMSVPEGLDVGSAYTPCARFRVNVASGSDLDHAPKVVIVSTANLAADPGTISAPSLNVADGQQADALPSGCNVYWVNAGEFKTVMERLQDKSWVAQCIVSIYCFPGHLLSSGPEVELFGNTGIMMHFLGETDSLSTSSEEYCDVPNATTMASAGLGEDNDLVKLYAYPYTVIEMGTLTGNPIYLKPQFIKGTDLSIWWLGCALAPFAKVGFFPRNYGTQADMADLTYSYIAPGGSEPTQGVIPGGDFLDTCVWLSDFPQFSIVNNAYITYMASTANTRAYNYQSAGWSLDRANAGAMNAYNNAQINRELGYAQSYNALNAGVQNANLGWVSGLIGTGAGALGGVAGSMSTGIAGSASSSVGGVAAGYGGLASTGINLVAGLAQNEIAMQQAQNSLGAQAANAEAAYAAAGDVADNNLGLARMVNQGDYQNRIAGINATVQDAALTPPSTSGQMGGNGFNWKNGLCDVYITWKTITGSALRTVADYFRRYGYGVRRFLPLGSVPSLMCMTKFAYWRVLETTVTCARANESERETIRGVFEKGVTLWASPADIGTTALTENHPKDGYSY